jgi:hypothetical protein
MIAEKGTCALNRESGGAHYWLRNSRINSWDFCQNQFVTFANV